MNRFLYTIFIVLALLSCSSQGSGKMNGAVETIRIAYPEDVDHQWIAIARNAAGIEQTGHNPNRRIFADIVTPVASERNLREAYLQVPDMPPIDFPGEGRLYLYRLSCPSAGYSIHFSEKDTAAAMGWVVFHKTLPPADSLQLQSITDFYFLIHFNEPVTTAETPNELGATRQESVRLRGSS